MKYHVKNNQEEQVMLWITGAGVSSWMYQHQYELPFKHLYFDLPGHGENSNVNFESIEITAKKIIELMDIENVEKAVVIGHSIGAQILLHMMDKYPSRIEHAFVVSGLNHPMKLAVSLISPMVSLTMPLLKYRWFSKAQSKTIGLPKYMFEEYYRDSLLISEETLRNILNENMTFSMDQCNFDGNKTTVLVGHHEKKIMKKSSNAIHLMLKGSRLLTLNASHGIPYEISDVFNQIIMDTLKK